MLAPHPEVKEAPELVNERTGPHRLQHIDNAMAFRGNLHAVALL